MKYIIFACWIGFISMMVTCSGVAKANWTPCDYMMYDHIIKSKYNMVGLADKFNPKDWR
jgi:hypothetical protein